MDCSAEEEAAVSGGVPARGGRAPAVGAIDPRRRWGSGVSQPTLRNW